MKTGKYERMLSILADVLRKIERIELFFEKDFNQREVFCRLRKRISDNFRSRRIAQAFSLYDLFKGQPQWDSGLQGWQASLYQKGRNHFVDQIGENKDSFRDQERGRWHILINMMLIFMFELIDGFLCPNVSKYVSVCHNFAEKSWFLEGFF